MSPALIESSSSGGQSGLDVQKHFDARAKLIASEKGRRQDHSFRQKLSPVAQQAHDIVAAIRQKEIHSYWNVNDSLHPDAADRFPGMMFPMARPYIGSTELWKIVRRMPKGALLHTHINAMLPYDILLEAILETKGMVISASRDVSTPDNQEIAAIVFAHTLEELPSTPSIHSPDYISNTRIPVVVAADLFPGGREAFLSFVRTKLYFSTPESLRHDLGVDAIWRRFDVCFSTSETLLTYEPIVRRFFQKLFETLAADGINWVEIRDGGSIPVLVREGEELPDPDLHFYWYLVLDEMEKFKATEQGKDFWGMKVIWCDWRGRERESLMQNMQKAIEAKQKFPHLLGGYDVVGQEDMGRPLADMIPELLWLQDQLKHHHLTMPFFFHAGETLGDGTSTDSNLFDAILLNTRRIGHGFSIYKHPSLMEMVAEKKILLEVCPISNEVLRLTTDNLHHPLAALIANGVPTALSNDDPALLGQNDSGLSYDFYQVIQGFENVGLAGLGALAENSIRWSNFEDQSDTEWIRDIDLGVDGQGVKAVHLREWHEKWESFCGWIVQEYGAKYLLKEEDEMVTTSLVVQQV